MRFPDFEEFYLAGTGNPSYDWQRRLARQFADGDFPSTIDVPTGLGKGDTALIALWALAWQVHEGVKRSMPQRIVHVVDRRRVVDESSDRMARWCDALNRVGPTSVLRPARQALGVLAGPWLDPVARQRVHGDAVDSGEWLRPTGCVLAGMTPHQVVSRLLFRGFGVSARTRSIHAGLLGVDCLLIFDEPHLSHQAVETIQSVLAQQQVAPRSLGVPASHLLLLGATVPQSMRDEGSVFTLSARDRSDSQVAARLAAPKPVRLRHAPDRSDAAFSKVIVDEVMAGQATHRRIGVMVNSVDLARRIVDTLTGKGLSSLLVTSRMRGIDRARLRLHEAELVVATQCLEVGVDISFDLLVTEECPYPVLIQRLGRLGRDGTSADPRAVVIVSEIKSKSGEDVKAGGRVRAATGAVYGATCVDATTRFLEAAASATGVVPFDLQSQSDRRSTLPAECYPAGPRLATFHVGYQPTMTTTYPTPYSDFPLDAFISGPEEGEVLDVLVSWRDDLLAVLDGCFPLKAEQVAVPVQALRALLRGNNDPPALADVTISGGGDTAANVLDRTVLRRTDDTWEFVSSTAEIRPGDRVVLRADLGGYVETEGAPGWSAASRALVTDQSLIAASQAPSGYRRNLMVPLSSATLVPFLVSVGWGPEDIDTRVEELSRLEDDIAQGLTAPDDLTSAAQALGLPADWQIKTLPSGRLAASAPTKTVRTSGRQEPQELAAHQRQVAATIHHAGQAAGVSAEPLAAARYAGRHHDDGKRHPPFQRYLGNVDPGIALAKSARGLVGKALDHRYAADAGHDQRWRHEGLSAAVAEREDAGDLAVHLVGSHHGRFRPLLASTAMVRDQVEGQAEHPGRASAFADLNREWGPWGLAYLESLVRLSDWHASAHPSGADSREDWEVPSHSPAKRRTADSDGVLLAGLLPSPMTGWFAVAGLLKAAELAGVPAFVRWSRNPDDLGVPRLVCSMALTELVSLVLDSSQWVKLRGYGEALDGNFTVKSQRLRPATAVRTTLQKASAARDFLGLAMAQDAAALTGTHGGLNIPIPAIANNANYLVNAYQLVTESAADRERVAERVTDALLYTDRGWQVSQCDGGMDRPAISVGVNGRESQGRRHVRYDLAPLAVFGMAAFGAGSVHGFNVSAKSRQCELPRPEDFVDLPMLGALGRLGPKASCARGVAWHSYAFRYLNKTDRVWVLRRETH